MTSDVQHNIMKQETKQQDEIRIENSVILEKEEFQKNANFIY